jgi:hypothetical protein
MLRATDTWCNTRRGPVTRSVLSRWPASSHAPSPSQSERRTLIAIDPSRTIDPSHAIGLKNAITEA